MLTKTLRKLLKSISLLSFILGVEACVTVPNTRVVTVLGLISDGASWNETQTSSQGQLSLTELMDMLEPQDARTCVPIQGFNICADDQTHGTAIRLPRRGGAVIEELEDWSARNVALEEACRQLGPQCSAQIRQALQRQSATLR